MARILSKSKTLKRQGVTIVLLLLLAGAYYALVVPGKTAYFEDRYFRQLAECNDNLRETIGTLCSSLINAATAKGEDNSTNKPSDKLIKDTLALSPYFSGNPLITTVSADTNALRLHVIASGLSPTLELQFTSTNGLRVRTHSELAQLMQAFVSRSEFHDVLLLGQTNEVLYQLSPGSLRLNQLKIPTSESFTTNLVNLAGGDFRLFGQPVRITGPPDSGSDTLNWVLCGLVREEQFRRQTWAMDYTMLAVFCFAALMLVVSWPLLNLWGGGLRGGLGLVEIFLLAFSALFVTALLTLTALDRYAYGGAKAQLDARLQSFSANLVTNLNAELKAVATQLEALDRLSKEYPDWTDLTDILDRPYCIDLDAPLYPWLRMVFWAGPDGQQTNKWTVKDQNTPLIKVRSRAYFRTIAEGRGWTNADGWTTNTYCLEPIYSRNTGENLAIYMTPSLTDPNRVVAIDLRLLTLVRPVVPVGYGFAVVDAEGAVLFHADEQRNLRENFFTECGRPAELRGKIYGRTAGWLTASYFQKPHRLYVTPLNGLPWSLVVFHDVTRLQLAEISIVSVAGLMFLLYAGGLLLAAIFFRLTDGARAFHWLWPRRTATESYWLLGCWLLALAAAAVFVAVWNPEPLVTFIVALAAPTVGLMLTHATLTFGWQLPKSYSFRPLRHWLNFWCMQISRFTRIPENVRVWRLDHRHGYVAAMGLLLVLAGVVPPLAFFRIAFAQEATLMVKHAQLRLAGELEAREDRVRAEVKGGAGLEASPHASLRVADPQKFIALRLSNRWDVHEFNCEILPADNKSKPARTTKAEMHGSFARFLRAMRPHFSELDVEPGGLWQDSASDSSWRWQREDGALVFWKDSRFGPLRLRAPLPHLTVPSPFWVLGFLIVLAMPFCILFFVADQVLLLREPLPVHTPPPWKTGKYLLLGPPHSNKSGLLNEDYFKALARKPAQLDLRLPEDRGRLAPARLAEWFTDTGQPVVVDHFEYQLEDARFNREKFRFLQEFAFDESRALIIVSNVHPLLLPLAADTEADPPGATALARLKQQRAETLAAYRKIYKDGESDLALATLPRDATVHLIRAHFRSLWVTCSPKEQEILHQVALGRLVGGRQPELGPLLERKLLTLNPGLQLLPDERFRRFILAHYHPDPDAELDEAASLWQAMKAPAATALIVVAAFFYLTQPALWKHTIGLTPAFIGGIGALMQVLGLFKRSKPEARPPQA